MTILSPSIAHRRVSPRSEDDPVAHPVARSAFVFYILTNIALLAFLLSSCFIRRPWHAPKAIAFKSLFASIFPAIIVTTFAFIGWIQLAVNPDFFDSLGESSKLPALITSGQVISYAFSFLQTILIANVLYRLTSAYNTRVRGRDSVFVPVALWRFSPAILGVLILLSISRLSFALVLCISSLAETSISPSADRDKWYRMLRRFQNLDIAGNFVFVIASIEILFEMCLITWVSKNELPIRKNGLYPAMLGCISFVALDIFNLIESFPLICYPWNRCIGTPDNHPKVTPAASFVCTIGLYGGIIHCCMQWYKYTPKLANHTM